MYGEYFLGEVPYSGEAVVEEPVEEFLDDWTDVVCDNTESWEEVGC